MLSPGGFQSSSLDRERVRMKHDGHEVAHDSRRRRPTTLAMVRVSLTSSGDRAVWNARMATSERKQVGSAIITAYWSGEEINSREGFETR